MSPKMGQSGGNNGRAQTYKVTSPAGDTYTITGELRVFCNKHNLSCAKVFKIIYGYKPTRGNCVGWSFERQLL